MGSRWDLHQLIVCTHLQTTKLSLLRTTTLKDSRNQIASNFLLPICTNMLHTCISFEQIYITIHRGFALWKVKCFEQEIANSCKTDKRFFKIFSHTSLAVKNLMRFCKGIGEEFKIQGNKRCICVIVLNSALYVTCITEVYIYHSWPYWDQNSINFE